MMVVYLSAPYTHPDANVMEQRRRIIDAAVAVIAERYPNIVVFSPISHSAAFEKLISEPKPHAWWMAQDRAIFKALALGSGHMEVWTLPLPEWAKSEGMRDERAWAEEFGVSVYAKLEIMDAALARAGLPTWKDA